MAAHWHYIVGDVHGCFDELLLLEQKILKHAHAHQKQARIICVGDLLDRGPKIRQVVEHFRQGAMNGTHLVVAGNHEAACLELLHIFAPQTLRHRDDELPLYAIDLRERYSRKRWPDQIDLETYLRKVLRSWIEQGGFHTLSAFGLDASRPDSWNFPAHIIDFLYSLPVMYETDLFVVTHALANQNDLKHGRKCLSGKSIDRNSEQHVRALHGMLWNREHPDAAPCPEKIHLSGHTPLDDVYKNAEFSYMMLDTGCVYGGQLTAYCPEAGEFFAVNSLQPRYRN